MDVSLLVDSQTPCMGCAMMGSGLRVARCLMKCARFSWRRRPNRQLDRTVVKLGMAALSEVGMWTDDLMERYPWQAGQGVDERTIVAFLSS